MEKHFYVYILASKKDGVLYIGVTRDLIKRTWEHKDGAADGFTRKYFVKKLVYYEIHDTAESAIIREKQLKKWNRAWKIRLLEEKNPEWKDLWEEITR